MDFAYTEEQQAIFRMAREFGAERIAPFAHAWEEEGSLPHDVLQGAAALGFGGVYVPQSYGGSGLSRLDGTLVFEALGMACPSVAAFLSIHNMCAAMINAVGSKALKDRWLARLATMEVICSYCLTEPGSGSDSAALMCRAIRTNSGFALSGTKAFISGAGFSDLYIVMCRTEENAKAGAQEHKVNASAREISAILVENGTPGLSFGVREKKMGWRAQPTALVQMDACRVPAQNLLGVEGRGFVYAMQGLMGGG